MAALGSPNTPSSIPTHSKKSVFSSAASARRPSTSSVSSPQGIGYSPGSNTTYTTTQPAGSGIPSFRTLRSLLPFGPNKNATPISASVSPNTTTTRSPFSGFGSVRRSMTKERERKMSLTNDATPVIAIERSKDNPFPDDTAIRRSASLSRLEKPLPKDPNFEGTSDPFREGTYSLSTFILRTPSPGPPLSAELSTIIEADSSGVSKNVPSLGLEGPPIDSRSSSPPLINRDFLHPQLPTSRSSEPSSSLFTSDRNEVGEADNSALNLSTEDLADQVRDALRKSSGSSAKLVKEWLDPDKEVVIIDGDEHPEVADTTFDTVDPDLMALLSPNSSSKIYRPDLRSLPHPPSHSDRERSAGPSSASPTTPTFSTQSSGSRLPRTRQASSFLPRPRPSQHSPSPSPTSPQFTIATPSPTTPSFSTANTTPRATPGKKRFSSTPVIAINGDDYESPSSPPRSPPPSTIPTTATSTPAGPRRASAMALPRATRVFSPQSSSLTSSVSPESRTARVFAGLRKASSAAGGVEEKTQTSTSSMASSSTSGAGNEVNGNTLTRPAPRTLRQVTLGGGSKSSISNTNDSSSVSPSPPSTSYHSSHAAVNQVRSRTPTNLGRGSLDSRRPPVAVSAATSASLMASNANEMGIGLGRPSLETRRGNSFESRSRPNSNQGNNTLGAVGRLVSSIERGLSSGSVSGTGSSGLQTDVDSSPSPEIPSHSPQAEPEPDHAFHRPSFDSTATRFSFDASRPGSVARLRERELERSRTPSQLTPGGSSRTGTASPIPRNRKRSMSVQERQTSSMTTSFKGRFVSSATNDHGIARPGSSLSAYGQGGGTGGTPGPKMEWLGPRTAKAFRAAGLLDFDKDRERERERGGGEVERDRGAPSPSPLNHASGASALNRFASLRSASEYNPTHGRAHSRMAFSEVGGFTASSGAGRRGSGSFSAYGGGGGGGDGYSAAGLMESPTFTVSTSSRGRDRDTPKSSTSTAPTSVESFGYFGRDPDKTERDRERDRDRAEMRELRERHGTEMAALLSALSDSQRTARVLREENSDLRDKVDRLSGVHQENDRLRKLCDGLENECMGLRRDYADLQRESAGLARSTSSLRAPGLAPSWSASSASSGFRTPVPKPGNSSPLVVDATPMFMQQQEEQDSEDHRFNDTIIIHDSIDDDDDDDDGEEFLPRHGSTDGHRDSQQSIGFPADKALPSSNTPSLRRRLSDTSSIFPIPPSNMTMLLHEDSNLGSNRSSADHSQYNFPIAPPKPTTNNHTPIPIPQPQQQQHTHVRSLSKSPPVTYRNFAGPNYQTHSYNKSVTSTTSISPTTANFSIATGSPGSLFLRPEHELLLEDMESLDLGVRGADLDQEGFLGRPVTTEDAW
ncbi:hypothetical protein M413DRAFT_30695 [Hebeloma cylindrosporum]|uniref:Uncharacterized protein n=1 Tax=Hebeloma cylindrosporum TaxID=76867 RepID=A0A0C2Y9R9_HEBCY|nr:hypothetical protein M413DRAFT_30695 [Hebeloma cylindrosporum h7]